MDREDIQNIIEISVAKNSEKIRKNINQYLITVSGLMLSFCFLVFNQTNKLTVKTAEHEVKIKSLMCTKKKVKPEDIKLFGDPMKPKDMAEK